MTRYAREGTSSCREYVGLLSELVAVGLFRLRGFPGHFTSADELGR
jgi:hypothetical protein